MNCPLCSTPVTSEWKSTNLKQCRCNTILFSTFPGKWEIATTSLVKIPSRYIKVGSKGIYDKRSFIITGRVFAQNEDSSINFWSICFYDGSRAILMDGYGHFSVMQKADSPVSLEIDRFKSMKAGDTATSKTKKHRLVRRDSYFKITVEGDNEWGDEGRAFDTYDFFSNDGQYTELIHFSDGKFYVFNCEFFLPDDLQLTNTVEELFLKTYKCINCNTENTIHAHPFTFSSNCKQCYSRYEYDVNKDEYIKARKKDDGYEPDIELNSIGILDGIEFRVIGYARKKERGSSAEWNEYTLYNPKMGFAYLSEFEGHWVYVKEWPRPPLITMQGRDYFVENDNEFELFNDYYYTVVGAVGEHIYDLHKTADYKVVEYIHPPQILTQEKGKHEENWFYGDHIESKAIKKNFLLPNGLPQKVGIGAVQPLAYLNKSTLFLVTALGIALLIITHLIISGSKREQGVFSAPLFFNESPNIIKGTTTHFTLDKPESNLEIKVAAHVTNSWVEFDGSFVNTATGKEYSFNKGVEYYEGYADGSKWTEGSRESSVVLSEIPAGNYYLEYNVVKDSTAFQSQYLQAVSMDVRYDVPLTRNLLWAAAFVMIVAVIQFSYYYYTDKKRWENSKYTPYNYE